MHRLYFRVYLAVLGSLALFAVLAGVTWRVFAEYDRIGPRPEFFQEAAERLAPPIDAAADAQRRQLEHWRALSGYELALFTADGRIIAEASDGALPSPLAGVEKPKSRHWRGPFGIFALQLGDGRWLVAARPRTERGFLTRFGWLAALLGLTGAVGIAAYPVVRRTTRGLERLQASVEALGAGNLSARVTISGRDEVARLGLKFNQSAARIEDLVRVNKNLLANASHELRSPLARLAVAAESLSSVAPAGTRDEIGTNIRELDQLIDEILLASRLDSQLIEPAGLERVDLVGLAAEECARVGAELDASSAKGGVITGDARLLRRLIRNLVENAQRHGGDTPVEVAFQPSGQPSGQPSKAGIIFDVLDRGPGIAVAERERIFEPFYRPPGVRERHGSVGLGLALVRQIVTRHGGTVECIARNGGGSCFRVSLPPTSLATD